MARAKAGPRDVARRSTSGAKPGANSGAKSGTKRGATRGATREPTLADEIAASGETGLSREEEADREQREDLLFLAREFLTWLVHHADGGGEFAGGGDVSAFTIGFGGRLTLRSPAGLVTDVVLKGPSPSTSPDLRYALAGGLQVKEADLRLEQDEREFQFALAAEHFDLKRVKLPELLAEDDDDERANERLALLDQLDRAVQHAFAHFLALRTKPGWERDVVPTLRAWLDAGT